MKKANTPNSGVDPDDAPELTDKDGEVRELTKDDLKHFKPAVDVLPKELVKVLPKKGRPISDKPKQVIR